jgi:hypothetical protein
MPCNDEPYSEDHTKNQETPQMVYKTPEEVLEEVKKQVQHVKDSNLYGEFLAIFQYCQAFGLVTPQGNKKQVNISLNAVSYVLTMEDETTYTKVKVIIEGTTVLYISSGSVLDGFKETEIQVDSQQLQVICYHPGEWEKFITLESFKMAWHLELEKMQNSKLQKETEEKQKEEQRKILERAITLAPRFGLIYKGPGLT